MEFLAERRLLANAVVCRRPHRRKAMELQRVRLATGGSAWLILYRQPPVTIPDYLCMYMWALDEPQDRRMHEAGISNNHRLVQFFFGMSVRTVLRMSE